MHGGAPEFRPAAARDRILEAALLRFSMNSYEATGLRDIAAGVGVDVAYMHRSFGSKEQLFAEAVRAALKSRRFPADVDDDLPGALARRVFAHCAETAGQVAPLDIIIRSLSSPEATPVLHDYVLKDFIDPLAERLERPAHRGAALIAAFLVGIGILSNAGADAGRK